MIRSLLLVLDRGDSSQLLLGELEGLLDRIDPVVDLATHASNTRGLAEAKAMLESFDVRLGRELLVHGDLHTEIAAWSAQTAAGLVVCSGSPPAALLSETRAPLLVLSSRPDTLRLLREVSLIAPEAPMRAATTLIGVCRGRPVGVRLVQETRDPRAAAAFEGARRRLEASGSPTLLHRRVEGLTPEGILEEAEGSSLIVLEGTRAAPALVSRLLGSRSVLVLPPAVRGAQRVPA